MSAGSSVQSLVALTSDRREHRPTVDPSRRPNAWGIWVARAYERSHYRPRQKNFVEERIEVGAEVRGKGDIAVCQRLFGRGHLSPGLPCSFHDSVSIGGSMSTVTALEVIVIEPSALRFFSFRITIAMAATSCVRTVEETRYSLFARAARRRTL